MARIGGGVFFIAKTAFLSEQDYHACFICYFIFIFYRIEVVFIP